MTSIVNPLQMNRLNVLNLLQPTTEKDQFLIIAKGIFDFPSIGFSNSFDQTNSLNQSRFCSSFHGFDYDPTSQ